MNNKPLIGIVTPTYQRLKFLKKFIANLKAQSYQKFVFVVVHDGPNEDCRMLCEKSFGGDERMKFINTPIRCNDWGVSPRIIGIEYLSEIGADYIALWDDDNYFYRYALETIRNELIYFESPRVLLVNLDRGYEVYPQYKDNSLTVIDKVDTGNLIVRHDIATMYYHKVKDTCGDLYSQDLYFFNILRSNLPTDGVAVSKEISIGLYDGLRPMYFWRRKLKLPTFGFLYQFKIYRSIRKFLRS